MRIEEAVAIAKDVARQNRWIWTGEVKATLHKPIPVLGWLLRQRRHWRVISNADDFGCNVIVTVDDKTRAVLSKRFGTR
jgi:hypothetical protein